MQNVDKKTSFLFQGQGGFHSEFLLQLAEREDLESLFSTANKVVKQELGLEFTQWLVHEPSDNSKYLQLTLEQIGIYIEGYLSAQVLLKQGVSADILLGHSFGEFTAMAVASVISFTDGIRLIIARLRALKGLENTGKMAAVSANEKTVAEILNNFPQHCLEISVINHEKQTVISGRIEEIESFKEHLATKGYMATVLRSAYPFHSSKLLPAQDQFETFAKTVTFNPGNIPVYFSAKDLSYDLLTDMPSILASHLITKFDYQKAIRTVYASGVKKFIECGGSEMLRNIIQRIFFQQINTVSLSGIEDYLVNKNSVTTKTLPSKKSINYKPVSSNTGNYKSEGLPMEAIAIVGYGSVLPGSENNEQYWHNTEHGKSGIYNYDESDPHFLTDYYSEGAVLSNKTYSRLCGIISESSLDAALKKEGNVHSQDYAKIQKMIALALCEALQTAELRTNSQLFEHSVCYFGATSDGVKEYDDALVMQQLRDALSTGSMSEHKAEIDKFFTQVLGEKACDVDSFSPKKIYERVLNDTLGREVRTVLIDAACSSSHYCIDLAMKSLNANETDIAICGGAFAAGIGNNCMFAQFNGLARDAIRPLDENAEGTVFCDGAVVLLLRRLDDALRDGDTVHGVIRGTGLSSDGKAPAVNVPTTAGQQLAIERAYRRSGIDKETIQYIEAHATGTSGDIIEFNSLRNVFSARKKHLPKIFLGSNKSMIGHTGWASGASAVVKVLQAINHQIVPAQYNLSSINSQFKIDDSPFEVPKVNLAWPENVNGVPLRAAINGFGFGGTNAHIIIEAFDRDYHTNLVRQKQERVIDAENCIVVGINSVFPNKSGISRTATEQRLFSKDNLTLPAGKPMLPDIKEHMSKAQYLSVIAADSLIKTARNQGVIPERIGVVLSFNDKCDRACTANLHIYKDRILRLIREASEVSPASERILEHVKNWYQTFETEHLPTGPYTLAGIMPNIITGRVANLYDLKGPNFIIGDNQSQGYAALKIAQDMLRCGDADFMLCGIMELEKSSFLSQIDFEQEGIVWLALTTKRVVEHHNLPIIAELKVQITAVDERQSYQQAV